MPNRRGTGQPDLLGAAQEAEPLAVKEFREEFARLVSDTQKHSAVSASRNRLLEALIARQTGWPSVGVKSISASKQIKNRISELINRRERLAHVVLLVPQEIVGHVTRLAAAYVGGGRGTFNVIAIVARDLVPPRVVDLIAADPARGIDPLVLAFPDMRVHAARGAPPDVEQDQETDAEQDVPTTDSVDVDSLDAFVEQTGIERALAESWLRRLRRKKHLVFQGPPGTGKTFVAKRLAQLLIAGSEGRIETLQFHPSYAYEDFVQGIRPQVKNGKVSYELMPGHFLKFCDEARKRPQAPFVLLIDEMNRGNLSKIFGELLFLLEYREESIPLAQGDERFSIPDNVHLLATMNTADRSIALIDHALRRRFSFVYLEPDYALLRRSLEVRGFDSQQLPDVLQRVNQAIGDRHYHLGVSFFLTPGATLRENIKDIWEGEIEPYLDEYFFDERSKVEGFRWTVLADTGLSWWGRADSE